MVDDLTQIADRELHLVRGKIPAGLWVVPVYVDFYQSNKKEYAKITPAVTLLADQHPWLYYTFSLHNVWKKRDVFLIERCFLEQFTEKAPGITPEYYFRWPGRETPPLQTRRRLKVAEADIGSNGVSEETEDFIGFVHKRRAVDRNILRLSIDLIAREATYWLTQKKKPIDLGFVKIHAVPYRANWKEILLARFRDIAWVFNSNKETKENALRQTEFYQNLCKLEMMSIDRYKRFIHWSIEAVPQKQFEDETAEIEMTKMAAGDTVYIRLYEKLVAALSPRIVEIFTSYVQKVSRPFAEIHSGLKSGSQKMVPYSGPKKLLPTVGDNIPVHIMVDSGQQKISRRERDAQLIVSPLNGLPKVPSLPSQTANVRQCEVGRDVDQPTDGKEGDPRMSLLLAPEKLPAEFQLLPVPGDESVADGDKRQ